jgi:hydroxyacylglutathione hydrolase
MDNVVILRGDRNRSNSYLFLTKNGCVLIDPSQEFKQYEYYLKKMPIQGIIITHSHFDHFAGLQEIQKNYPMVPIFLHSKTIEKITNPSLNLAHSLFLPAFTSLQNPIYEIVHDGEKRTIDDTVFQIFFTPGHTEDSISIYVSDSFFTGDSLFCMSCGRTDLPSGSEVQMKKTMSFFAHFKKNATIYPGHDEITSLEEEQKHNPFLNSQKIK